MQIYKQYDDTIRTLKQEGALLNHIRPEFLLSYNEYLTYIKQIKDKIEHVPETFLRLNPIKFSYL